MTTTIDSILDDIAQLSIEDQEMVREIVHKRIIEKKRDGIHAAFLTAMEERTQGKTKSGTVDDLFPDPPPPR
ncbi:MAG: hypothetical protein EA383_14300 [Spirochaetaceae bacterium]|nr:MAG: hypothetical protein EA383_14300 [Spirochaetaceae bacterium]